MTHSAAELDAFAAWERESWQERAEAYAERVGRLTRGAVPALLDAARIAAGSRVLDVGTGPGFVAEGALARGATVTAVDQSAVMAGICAQRLPGADVRVAPAEQLALPSASYDAAVAGFLLNHLARPAVALAEMVRVLAPGGRLALTVWDLPTANRGMGLVGEVVTELGLRGVVPPGPDATGFADDALLGELLADAGLDEVSVTRAAWSFVVEPEEWFDTVAAAMPRSGAVLALVDDGRRAEARAEFASRARASFVRLGDAVELPAGAVVGAGRLRP